MINKIINKLKNNNIAILGFGKEGKSTYNFIRRYLPDIKLTVIDKNEISLIDNNITIISGDDYLDNINNYDLIIKSPGISLKDIDIDEEKITSQLELLLEVDKDNIIGITGTKGKSTTSSLIYEVIKNQYDNTYLVGNIGTPIFDEIELFDKDSLLVVEMSSHQLEYIKYSPHIAVMVNLYIDHLDHDGSIEKYHKNKMNIFKYQNSNDYSIYADDNDYLIKEMNSYDYKGIKYTVRFDYNNLGNNSIRIKDKDIYFEDKIIYTDDKRKILGDHNLKNIMFVLGVGIILDLDISKCGDVIKEFNGLKYRMEFIGKQHDIYFYNDTIATIPEATINAIETIGNVDTLIFGGLDRGLDYNEFIKYLNSSNISNFICMPTTGNIIGKQLINKNIYFVNTLEEAYKTSLECTKKNMSCLLSPAAASYEYFKNFEEKGKLFEELVKRD